MTAVAVASLLYQQQQGVKEHWTFVATGVALSGRSVLIFDNRSMGESTLPSADYAMTDMSNDLALLIEAVYPQQKVMVWGIR